MRALSIQQPYAEEILRGKKRVEYRSIRTKIINERFYIYASKKPGDSKRFLALGAKPGKLPTGVLVGTAVISKCTGSDGKYHWHLTSARRRKHPRRPSNKPQPVWFNPF